MVHDGRIVAERYAPGFSAATPLLGWSMTKSVVAGLVGLLVKDGALTLEQSAGWPAGDDRARIRIADLLAMSSGLRFNESYGAVSDVTRMLYLQPDMAGFARAQPPLHAPGEFWSYSSGTRQYPVAHRAGREPLGGPTGRAPVQTLGDGERHHGDRRTRHSGRLLLYVRHRARLGALSDYCWRKTVSGRDKNCCRAATSP